MITVACVLNAIESQQPDSDIVEATNEAEIFYHVMAMSKDNILKMNYFGVYNLDYGIYMVVRHKYRKTLKMLGSNDVVPKNSPHRHENAVNGAKLSSDSASRRSPVSVQYNNA
jgi:hypothetical protein